MEVVLLLWAQLYIWGRHSCDQMIFGLTASYAVTAYHYLSCDLDSLPYFMLHDFW